MSRSWLPFFGAHDDAGDAPSIRGELRAGEGALLRIGLSLAAASLAIATLMLVLGTIELAGRVDEEHVIVGVAVTGAAWCGILAWLWSSYRRWRRLLLSIFVILGIWLITIPLCVLIGETVREAEFLIAACIFTAIAATIVTIVVNAHFASAGRPLMDRGGGVAVRCPACGYSMVGLESCQCPECGATYTIDTLIREQDYAAVRRETSAAVTGLEAAPTA